MKRREKKSLLPPLPPPNTDKKIKFTSECGKVRERKEKTLLPSPHP
jgi:hypothetical protein